MVRVLLCLSGITSFVSLSSARRTVICPSLTSVHISPRISPARSPRLGGQQHDRSFLHAGNFEEPLHVRKDSTRDEQTTLGRDLALAMVGERSIHLRTKQAKHPLLDMVLSS
jgi:hypothetical protein